jgi:hypothetical protein
LKLEDILFMVERYYDPSQTLKTKLEQDKFDTYIANNPMLLKANQVAAAKEEARKVAEKKRQ